MERSFATVIGRRPAVRPGLPLLTPRKLIETATITAARVLGLDDRIGSLTPAKRADIVLIRKGPFGDSAAPDACAHVLLQTSPRDIDTVIVDGEIAMRGGRLTRIDERALIAEFRDVHAEMLDRIEASERASLPLLEGLRRIYARCLEESIPGDVTRGMIG